MSTKLKAIGLTAVALTSLSAIVAMNALAETGGHFTSDSPTHAVIVKGTENTVLDTTELNISGLSGIVCGEVSYEGTPGPGAEKTPDTVESIGLVPRYGKCKTTNGTAGEVTIDTNGCEYRFKIGKKSTADNTVDLFCPKLGTTYISVTHPNCEVRVPSQNGLLGVAYTTILDARHSLTLDVTLKKLTAHFESGACVLLGTKRESELTGSIVVDAFEDLSGFAGAQVNITATGSEG